MVRSSGFGSTTLHLSALFRLAFASAPQLHRLTSHNIVTRRPVLQKVRHHTLNVLCLLVSIGFQVLFHSPPGVLFTFPSRYYTLSVTWSYLAFGDGPPSFRQDSSCPDVLWVLLALIDVFAYGTLTLSHDAFQHSSANSINNFVVSPYPKDISTSCLGCSNFARHYFRNRFCFLFLRVLRCFSSPGSPCIPILFSMQ